MDGRKLPCELADLPDLGRLLRVIADETRLRMLCVLRQSGRMYVGELCGRLGLPQNLVSHHLAVLSRAGLVRRWRDEENARRVCYSVNAEALESLNHRYLTVLGTPVAALERPGGGRCDCQWRHEE